MPMTNTWRRRLTSTHSWLRRAGLIVGLTSCSIVAIATIWGWIANDPIDVSGPGPHRSQPHRPGRVLRPRLRHPLADRHPSPAADPARLLVTARPDAAAHHPGRRHRRTGGVSGHPGQRHRHHPAVERRHVGVRTPLRKRRPAHHLLPAARRCTAATGCAPARCPPASTAPAPAPTRPLGYPVTLAATSPAFTTVAGFLTSYLTAAGGLERYVTTDSGLLPAADYRSAQVTKLLASATVPDQGSSRRRHHRARAGHRQRDHQPIRPPPGGLPPHAERHQRPLDRRALDYAPLLAPDAELTPVIPTPAAANGAPR